jgi:hypothetical protein
VLERGVQVRIKIIGVRMEVGNMFAVATIREVCVPMLRNHSIANKTFIIGLSRVRRLKKDLMFSY